MDYSYLKRDCWLEIDLDRLRGNFQAMKEMVGPGIKIMPAVKANAYSHGIIACCQELAACGADYLGVGNIDEAVLLRENGVTTPLLIFAGNLVTEVAEWYIRYNLIPTILTVDQAKAISSAAEKPHPVFSKIDTGRGRLGVNAEDFPELFRQVAQLPNIVVEGVYSHMGAADWPDKSSAYAMWQYERFQKALEGIGDAAETIPFRQLANTPGSIAYPGIRMTGVCPGRAIWGFSPLERREGHPDIQLPMVAWKSRLLHVNNVIGGKFGEKFAAVRLDSPKRIGVMAGGISDGIHPNQAKFHVLVRGKKVPVASTICLEHTILDLSGCPEAVPGDEVVIFGRQGSEEITMEELRTAWGKDLMSFWTAITPHVQRVYLRGGKPCCVSSGDTLTTINH